MNPSRESVASQLSYISSRSMGSSFETSSHSPSSRPSIWEKFAGLMDIHGLQQINSAHAASRIVWICLLLLSSCVMVVNIIIAIVEYTNNPIITTYSLHQEQSLLLPSLYICPFNYVNGTILEFNEYTKERIDEMVNEYLKNKVVQVHNPDENMNDTAVPNIAERILLSRRNSLQDIAGSLMPAGSSEPQDRVLIDDLILELIDARYDGETPQEFFKRIGYDAHQFIKACSFSGKLIDCSSYIREVFDKDRGKCFLFDPAAANAKRLEQFSPSIGLSLVLDVWINKYPPSTSVHRMLFNGVSVKLARNFDPTSPYEVLLQPGRYTKVSLEHSTVMLANISSGKTKQKCSHKSRPLKVLNTEPVGGYSRSLCVMDCMQAAVEHLCGCVISVDPFFLNIEFMNSPLCTATNHSQCTHAATNMRVGSTPVEMTNATMEKGKDTLRQCILSCSEACDLLQYSISSSSLSFPAPNFCPDTYPIIHVDPDSCNEIPPPEHSWCNDYELKENYIIVDIAYGTMSHKTMEQKAAVTFNTLMSNLGGQLGLWVGASLFTIIQLIVFIITLLCQRNN